MKNQPFEREASLGINGTHRGDMKSVAPVQPYLSFNDGIVEMIEDALRQHHPGRYLPDDKPRVSFPATFLSNPFLPKPWQRDDYLSIQEVDWETLEPIHSAGAPTISALPAVSAAGKAKDNGTKLRHTFLADEVRRTFEAISFFNWKTGMLLNTEVTISFAALCPDDPIKAFGLLSAMNKAAREWLKGRDLQDGSLPRRRSKRSEMGGSDHSYVYIVENARDRGLHVHQLMFVPKTKHRLQTGRPLRKSTLLARYLRSWWAKQLGLHAVGSEAVFVYQYTTRREENAIYRQWKWLRYVGKTLHPDSTVRYLDGRSVSARDVFRCDPYIETRPAAVAQLSGCSHNINTLARDTTGFVSAYRLGAPERMYSGWELEEFKHRNETDERKA